jgi:hypothetical protein
LHAAFRAVGIFLVCVTVISIYAHFGPLPTRNRELVQTIRTVSFWTGKLSLPAFCLCFLIDARICRLPRAMIAFWSIALAGALVSVFLGVLAWEGKLSF